MGEIYNETIAVIVVYSDCYELEFVFVKFVFGGLCLVLV